MGIENEDFDLDDISASIQAEIASVETAAAELDAVDEPQQDEAEDDAEIDPAEVHTLVLCRKTCINCKHLLPEVGTKLPTNCHYTKGNEDCPAKDLKIIIGVNHNKIADQLVDATLKQDAAALASIWARLNRHDPVEIKRTTDKYTEKLAQLKHA